jgi:hypothetical protein
MTQPRQHLSHRTRNLAWRNNRPVDQDHSRTQRASGDQLGLGPAAAGVFGDDMGDTMGLQQRRITRHVERAPRDHGKGVGQGQSIGPIHQPQQVEMLLVGRKRGKILFANRQKNTRWRFGQGRNRSSDIRHMLPVITLHTTPRRALKSQQRDRTGKACLDRVPAHLRSKGVGGIYDMGDMFRLNICDQTSNTAKPAHAHGQGLRHGLRGAAGIGKHCIRPAFGQSGRKVGCLGRTAQQENAHG